MSLASSKLNPHAAAYVPLAKRVEDESKLAPVHFDSSLAFTGSSSNNTTEFHSEEGQLEMDLAYLQTLFPSVSEQSLIDVYFVNECDLDAAYDMMSQLEHSDSVSSLSLPDSLEIGDVSEPHILPHFANLKLKEELEGVSSSASVNSPAHAQAQSKHDDVPSSQLSVICSLSNLLSAKKHPQLIDFSSLVQSKI